MSNSTTGGGQQMPVSSFEVPQHMADFENSNWLKNLIIIINTSYDRHSRRSHEFA